MPAPEALTVHRPSDGHAHAPLPLADAAVQDAHAAFRRRDWARRARREQGRVQRWADLIEADVQQLAAAGKAVVLSSLRS